MNAFEKAIKKIDKINAPEEIKPTMIKAFLYFSNFFDKHPQIKLDFDDLFDKKLYSSDEEKNGVEVSLLDNSSDEKPADHYSASANEITMIKKEKYDECDVHIFMRNFIRFIIHNTYENYLPSWADDMMTEFSAKAIHGNYYGHNLQLVDVADIIDENFAKVDIEQFFNGEFNDFINKYHLSDMNAIFDKLKQSDNKNSFASTMVVSNFLELEAYKIMKKDVSLDEFLHHLTHKTINQHRLNRGEIVKNLNLYVADYLGLKYDIHYIGHTNNVKDYITLYYVKELIEKTKNTEILGIEKIVLNGVTNYIAYGNDGKNTMLLNFGEDKECFCDLRLDCVNQISLIDDELYCGATHNESYGTLNFKVEKGDQKEKLMLKYNKISSRFEMPFECEHKYYHCMNNAILKELKNEIEKISYQKKCDAFNSKNIARVHSSDFKISSRLIEIKNVASLYKSEILCIPASFVGASDTPELAEIYSAPIYRLKDYVEDQTITIDSLSVDGISEILKDKSVGSQVNFVVKNQDGELLPIANVMKLSQSNDFALHTNYNAFINDLPANQKQEIYKKYIQKQDLFEKE